MTIQELTTYGPFDWYKVSLFRMRFASGIDISTTFFTPELCNSIAMTPAGFRVIALQGSLSTQMIRILEETSKVIDCVNRAMCRMPTTDEIMLLLSYKPHLLVQDA